MKLPFVYMCGIFVKLFPFSFSMQICPFSLEHVVACYYCSCALAFPCIRCDGQWELCPPGAGDADCAPSGRGPVSWNPEITEPRALPECSHSTGLGEWWKPSLWPTVMEFVHLVIADVLNVCFFIKKSNTKTLCLQFGSVSVCCLSPNQDFVFPAPSVGEAFLWGVHML